MSRRPLERERLRVGERVRIVGSASGYSGCRGIVSEPPYPIPEGDHGHPVGYYVEVDGEKGGARPFLPAELERVRVARVRPPDPSAPRRKETEAGGR